MLKVKRYSEPLARKPSIHRRVVPDMNSTEIPVCGEQEQGAYDGHFECTRYHPLLLFNREGGCQYKQRPDP
jgi:hypothetical protein